MNPLWCPHTAHTATDKDGYAICLMCGSAISVWLSKARVERTLRAMRERG